MALTIKKEWLDLISAGTKTWEIRGTSTVHRGFIHFAESGSGQLRGRAKLVGCRQLDRRTLMEYQRFHQLPNAEQGAVGANAGASWLPSVTKSASATHAAIVCPALSGSCHSQPRMHATTFLCHASGLHTPGCDATAHGQPQDIHLVAIRRLCDIPGHSQHMLPPLLLDHKAAWLPRLILDQDATWLPRLILDQNATCEKKYLEHKMKVRGWKPVDEDKRWGPKR